MKLTKGLEIVVKFSKGLEIVTKFSRGSHPYHHKVLGERFQMITKVTKKAPYRQGVLDLGSLVIKKFWKSPPKLTSKFSRGLQIVG